ncbi:MAG: bifunctional glutamate N-acetyltransferase/amino-acid acetyltransferase ArgJ [Gammaproteobacteria bacterium]
MKEVKIGCSSSYQKYGKRLDTAIIQLPSNSNISGLFTSNKFPAAPVKVAKRNLTNLDKKKKTALFINAGNANAATGPEGLEDINKMFANYKDVNVLPFSTGVIGERLDLQRYGKSFFNAYKNLGKSSWKNFATSIMTTDKKEKIVKKSIKINGETINFIGIAKGSAMIEPNMATMLSFVFTDLKISKLKLDKIHRLACEGSFNSITIDGDQSTNDSSLLIATGSSLIETLQDIFYSLAEKIVLDAEGATKLISITVKGLKTENECKTVAKNVANSLLVKTAAFGEDPNWGRILMAVGNTNISFDEKQFNLKLGKLHVFRNNKLSSSYSEKLGLKEFKKRKIEIVIKLGDSNKTSKVLTSDLSKDYVSMNADYRS